MDPTPRLLAGRNALITGASGGLGRHFGCLLARAGATVALCARRREELDALAEDIRRDGGNALALTMDVGDAASVADAVAEAARLLGGLDILINNAGVTAAKPLIDMAESEWDAVLDTNLKGAFLVARQVARVMRDSRRGGAIVNIASILGLRVAGQVGGYSASKAGLVQLTKTMALEWARHGIRVNALCPGYIETDLNRDFFAGEAGQAMLKRIPMRRLGRPEDLDGAALLLCSEASAYITGAVLAVDGGHLVSSL